jgi:ABC-type uncharacterized transport system substrate-binding protein
VNAQNTNDRRPFQTAGERLDNILGDASKQVEQQTQALIDYINDEVVPLIRENSSKGLHVAADKLKDFANYMDSKKQNQG